MPLRHSLHLSSLPYWLRANYSFAISLHLDHTSCDMHPSQKSRIRMAGSIWPNGRQPLIMLSRLSGIDGGPRHGWPGLWVVLFLEMRATNTIPLVMIFRMLDPNTLKEREENNSRRLWKKWRSSGRASVPFTELYKFCIKWQAWSILALVLQFIRSKYERIRWPLIPIKTRMS